MSKELIGISVGSQTSIIGILKGKVADIILSDSSNRRIPTMVSYADRERCYGDQSQSSAKSNFKRTVAYPSRWLGVQKDWPFIEEESKYAIIPPKLDKNNRLGFEIKYKGNTDSYTAESLMGLYFQKLKKNWLREKVDTKEVVVAVPDYYTAHERKAMLEALEIANLQCNALINESSAISLTYGLLRLRDFDQEKPRIVSFVDMGQSKTTIFFGSFTQKKMKVISVTNERFCGAREFDYLLAQEVAKDFMQKFPDLNPMKAPKIRMRLLDAIAKVRKTLTVNKEASLSIDSLMDGEDCYYQLTKEKFEKIIEPVLQKFRKVCKDAIARAAQEAKIKLSDVHSVEMVGDAVRTPIIQAIIKEEFGKDLSKTLAPDECIARGCTLYAAMSSPYYTIMNFEFEPYNPYSVIMEYPFIDKTGALVTRTYKIISRGENVPGKKSIKFTEKQTPKMEILNMKFSYDNTEVPWMPNQLLKAYNVHMPKDIGKEFTFALQFYLDGNCLPALTKASIDEVYFEEVPVKTPPKKEEPKKEEPKKEEAKKEEGKKEEGKKEEPKKEEAKKEEPKKEEPKKEEAKKEETKKEEPKKEEAKKEEPKKEEPPKMEKVKRERSSLCTLETTDTPYGTVKGILDQIQSRENEQENDDKAYLVISHKKNAIEQFIYNTREKMENVLIPHITQAEKEKMNKLMDPVLDWLYSDDENIYNKKALEEHSKDMYELGNKIYSRLNNWTQLNENISLLDKAIVRSQGIIKEETEKIGKKTTILNEGDVLLMQNAVNDAQKKINEFKEKEKKGNKLEEPILMPNEVSDYTLSLNKAFEKVYYDADVRKKKEEEERKKKEEEEKKKKEEEEKKKKEEEEKKKKEEEDKKKKEEKKDDKKEGKKEEEDVEMKDVSKEEKKEEKKDEKKSSDAMDVE